MSTEIKEPERIVEISAGRHRLTGILNVPKAARGIVTFAHGSGSGRFSPRNQYVAGVLQRAGLATLLIDLLEVTEAEDRDRVFDIELLAGRLQSAADWLAQDLETKHLRQGYFGASTGAAAALVAAARNPTEIAAVVSRGGRPDLARAYLPSVQAPTLLIVGGDDNGVVNLNQVAFHRLGCHKELVIIPGATHLFPEPGALEEVAHRASRWFGRYLGVAGSNVEGNVDNPNSQPVASALPLHRRNRWETNMFINREDAARQLAEKLMGLDLHDPLVLAIPRGGVVIGSVLARAIGADLDVVLSRKLRAPDQPELAVGAVSEDGEVYLNRHAQDVPNVTEDYLIAERRHQVAEMARRKKLFRAVRPQAPIIDRTVIVTDDGIATGSTMIAALQMLKAQGPHEVIVAVPVATPERIEEIQHWCDHVVCLLAPEEFWAIGQFYVDFSAVEDDRVVELLREFRTGTRTKELAGQA